MPEAVSARWPAVIAGVAEWRLGVAEPIVEHPALAAAMGPSR